MNDQSDQYPGPHNPRPGEPEQLWKRLRSEQKEQCEATCMTYRSLGAPFGKDSGGLTDNHTTGLEI